MGEPSEQVRRGNPEPLRADIDRGRTGDKIPVSDPAAAPLGTDEEAAGTPLRPEILEDARRRETGRASAPVHRSGTANMTLLAVVVAGLALLTGLVMLYWAGTV